MGFYNDLNNARAAEWLVRNTLQSLDNTWDFKWVGDVEECFHIGDIEAIDTYTGFSYFIEVKDDSRIAGTGNVLCETRKYFFNSGEYRRGNIYNTGDYYCVVSQQDRKIYVLDFQLLRRYYQWGEYTWIEHDEDITYCYLVPLKLLEKKGALLHTICY